MQDFKQLAIELAEALENLLDEQNGPPLERYKENWEKAYDAAQAALASTLNALRATPKSNPQPAPAFRWTAEKIREAVNEAGICYSVRPENENRLAEVLNAYMDRHTEPEKKPEPEAKACKLPVSRCLCEKEGRKRYPLAEEDEEDGIKGVRLFCPFCDKSTVWVSGKGGFYTAIKLWNAINS